jgi:CIC family chloride channel protein
MLTAGACLVVGVLGFVAWKGFLAAEVTLPGVPSRVALERSAVKGEHPFRVLVPLANPANVPQLMDLAAGIAADRNGEIVAMRVAVVPEQLPPSREDSYVERERQILETAHAIARQHDIPISSLVRVGHDAARAILETASERDCDLIVIGWKGYTSTAKKILGEVVDAVVQHAQADLLLVKQTTHEPLRRFLLPTAGGEHARCAEEYLASFARSRGAELTVCSVAPPDAGADALAATTERLSDDVARISRGGESAVDARLIQHRSVTVGILQEAKRYDAVVIGATGQGTYQQMLFGSIPESIAKRADRPVILVKHYHPVKALIRRVVGDGP